MSTILEKLNIAKYSAVIDLVFKFGVLFALLYTYNQKKWPFESAQEKAAKVQVAAALGAGEFYNPQSAIPPLVIFLFMGIIILLSLTQFAAIRNILQKIPYVGQGLAGRY